MQRRSLAVVALALGLHAACPLRAQQPPAAQALPGSAPAAGTDTREPLLQPGWAQGGDAGFGAQMRSQPPDVREPAPPATRQPLRQWRGADSWRGDPDPRHADRRYRDRPRAIDRVRGGFSAGPGFGYRTGPTLPGSRGAEGSGRTKAFAGPDYWRSEREWNGGMGSQPGSDWLR